MRSIQFRMAALIVLSLGLAAAVVAFFFDRTYEANSALLASKSIRSASPPWPGRAPEPLRSWSLEA